MNIGPQIRKLRKVKDMSLKQLSEASGVQIATISRIENQKMTGTLECHLSLSRALGVELSQLYESVESSEHFSETNLDEQLPEIFKFNEKASYEILVNRVRMKKMLPYILKIEPGGSTGDEQLGIGSEKFIFTLTGELTAVIGGKEYSLKKYHSLYFDATQRHSFKNNGKSTVKALSLIAPIPT